MNKEENNQTLRPSPTALLNPRIDPTFKAIFTQETKDSYEALQSFLSSILERKIKNVSLSVNEPPVDNTSEMQMSFDVSVTFENGEKASIEMQGRNREYDFPVRSEIQVARLLNINAKKGDSWESEKVYQISVLNFHLPKDDKCELTWYNMKNQKGRILSGHLNVIYIDLLVIKKLVGTPVEKLTPLQKWGLYLSYADDESKSDYIKQITRSEEGIMAADLIIGKMSEDEANWFRQNSYDIAMRDRNTELKNSKKKAMESGRKQGLKQGLKMGIQQGIQQGFQQKAFEDAENFLREKIPPEQVARCIGLPLEKVLELQKKITVQA